MKADSVPRSALTYNTLITAYGHAGAWQKATEVLAAMEQDQCVCDTVTYNSLISAYASEATTDDLVWKQAVKVSILMRHGPIELSHPVWKHPSATQSHKALSSKEMEAGR
jgi:pentatricopeptide repeat protein